VYEDGDERDDPIRLEALEDVWRHDGLGHSAGSDGSNYIAKDVVLETFLCECLGEANLGKFGGRVIALAKAAKETGR